MRAWCASYEDKVRAFDRATLSARDQLNRDVFLYNQELCRESLAIDFHLMPIDQGGYSLIATFPVWGSGKGPQPFRTVRDYENFLRRIDGFVQWMDTAIANMRRGMARGLVQPRASMESVLPQLAAMMVDDPKRSVFYEPILNFPAPIDSGERARLAARYEAAIREQIVPAYGRMHAFIRDEYLAKTRASAGLSSLPEADRLYAYLIRLHTTTALKPAEIQAIGRREMAATRQAMEALTVAAGFKGSLKAWAAQLQAERVRYTSAEEVIAAYRSLHERVYPRLAGLFHRLPEAKYEIRAVEGHREEGAPSQYWRAGPGRPAVFYVNLRGLKTTPIGISESLFLHETLPGHHLQIALAQESTGLPNFRRVGGYSAYVEGWASYAETLGHELGLYRDSYQQLVALNGDLYRAAALIADVGLHVEGWSRERAVEFLLEETLTRELFPDAERGARSGVERAMVWPAFTMSYKIGQLKMLELRARAQARLGVRFEVRAFHHEILKDGALPLAILEEKIDRWIASLNQ